MQDSKEIFSAKDIRFHYDRGPIVLDKLSFTVRAGEKIVLLGENGSGKSTLFKLMTATERPVEGQLYWQGEPYNYHKKFLRKLYSQLGLVFQDSEEQLFAASVEQEVSFGAVNLGLSEDEVRARVDHALTMTRTQPLRDRPLEQISFGEKKRVSIADLLVMDNKLLLLDEPTAWLDNRSSSQIVEVLEELSQSGVTIIVSTHDVDLAWALADRILILGQGRLLHDGTPEEAFNNHEAIAKAGLHLPLLLSFDKLLQEHFAAAGKPARSLADLEAKMKTLSAN
ncbi:MAG: ABC transporter ATP-binding protein [Eubacteriales bacterium]|nr:ABC transporter ATP-binding protein [Eubacteriales bacterium]